MPSERSCLRMVIQYPKTEVLSLSSYPLTLNKQANYTYATSQSTG